MDELIKTFLLPFLVAVGTVSVGEYLRRRATLAKAKADSGDAAESLSNAAAKQIEVYQQSVITPMQKRIDDLTSQLSVVEEDRHEERMKFKSDIQTLQGQVARLTSQQEFMRGELKRADTALEYMVGLLQQQHPNETMQAIRIRRGEIT